LVEVVHQVDVIFADHTQTLYDENVAGLK
jgi:hypothetical protein